MQFQQLGHLHTWGLEELAQYNRDRKELASDRIAESLQLWCKIWLPESVRLHLQSHPEAKDIISLINIALESYEEVCTPDLMAKVRSQSISKQKNKWGVDFATEIDLAVEDTSKSKLFSLIGQDIKVYWEEAWVYIWPKNATKLFRIDPIDGTGEFKGSWPDFSLMFGKYSEWNGRQEQLDYSVVYFPEKEWSVLHLYIRGLGNFLINTAWSWVGDFVPLSALPKQNNIEDMNISIWKHSDVEQSHEKMGDVEAGVRSLKPAQIHITRSASADVLYALIRQWRQAMIIDWDYNIVDFIPFAAVEELGYEIFDRDGTWPLDPADYSLDNRKLVVVPAGSAWVKIREMVQKIAA